MPTSDSEEIELLLAHVERGYIIVDRAGKIGGRHSAVMERWFGARVEKGALFWSLFREDARLASHLELAWEGLFDDFLPIDVALDQFPKLLRHQGLTFELGIHPVRDDDGLLSKAVVSLTDATERLLRDEAEAQRSDLVALCERAIADRGSVIDFVNEGDSLHRAIAIGETLVDLRRAVHTLKGVAAQAGAAHIAESCEAIEQGMACRKDGTPKTTDIATLSARWALLTSRLRSLFANAEPTVAVTKADADGLLAAIVGLESHAELARKMRLLMLEPMQIRLDRLKEGARALGRRLGKEIEVTGRARGLRSDPQVWAPFWSAMTHLVRNALVHGLGRAGKLSIDVMRGADEVIVEVTDDGAGVDWEAVEKKARAAGLAAETRRDLEQALFADGFSTRDVANELSGRGMGLAAVRATTEKMGGIVSVYSARGEGTLMRFTFPLATLGSAYVEETATPQSRSIAA